MADRLNKASNAAAAALLLDEARGLPEDQYRALVDLRDRRFPSAKG